MKSYLYDVMFGKVFDMLLILCLTSSCGIVELGGPGVEDSSSPVWISPSYQETTPSGRSTCYITALDYPDGYNWISDKEVGTVRCSLVVFADGVPVMKIPVGDEHFVSGESDMHRVIGGQVYTDYSTESHTIIKRNAEELFRYEAREMICDMVVVEDDVYTLGQNRDSEGFSFRRNGTVMMKRESGYTFGRLQHSGDSICFAFSEPVRSVEGVMERYYHVINGKVSQVAVREDVNRVWDILFFNGKVFCLLSVTGLKAPVLYCDGELTALEMSSSSSVSSCRFIASDKSLFVEGTVPASSGRTISLLWKGTRLSHSFSGMTVSSLCSQDDGICCIAIAQNPSRKGIIYRCGETFDIPSGYFAVGAMPMAIIDGILHVGLSSQHCDKPMIWKDGIVEQLDINGPICTVTSVLP